MSAERDPARRPRSAEGRRPADRRLRLLAAGRGGRCGRARARRLAPHAPHAATAFLPQGTNGIVVLDLSASISNETYGGIAATLDRLARSRGRYGLVVFSDTAYQALPPGTPAAELERVRALLHVPQADDPRRLASPLPVNPWTDSFSAGTRISTGLQLALDVIRTRHLAGPGVVLVSDLDDDPGDLEALTSVALAYRKLGIPLRVVGLNP